MIGQGYLIRRRYFRRWALALARVCAAAVGESAATTDPLSEVDAWLADIQYLRNACDPLVALWADTTPTAEAIQQTWAAQKSIILQPAQGPYEPWDSPLPAAVMAAWQTVLITPSTGQTWPAYEAATATISTDAWRLAAHVLLEQAFSLSEAAIVILEMEQESPVLAPSDLESITADTRQLIQAAIEVHRAMFPMSLVYPLLETLRDLAARVGDLAAAALAKTPPVVQRTLPASMPPVVLAQVWYGDYRRVADLRRLNPSLGRRPHDWRAGESVRAYLR